MARYVMVDVEVEQGFCEACQEWYDLVDDPWLTAVMGIQQLAPHVPPGRGALWQTPWNTCPGGHKKMRTIQRTALARVEDRS